MKHVLPFMVAAISVAIFLLTLDFKSGYCTGWEKGYKSGYCYEIENCVEPVVPVCPIPNIGDKSEQDGYNRGFTEGKAKRDGKGN